MRNIFNVFIILIICGQGHVFGQMSPSFTKNDTVKLVGGSFEFIQSLPKNLSVQLDRGTANSVEINKGNKISVLYEYNDTVYFKYWNFNSTSTLFNKYNNGKIFSIEKRKFEQITRPLYKKYKGVAFGGYAIPFRLRSIGGGEDFDFESSLSLQANLVFGFGSIYKQDSWLDMSIGIGLTGVNLNNKNSTVTEDRTASAFTISLGGVYKPGKFANIGLFCGWDFLGQNDNEVDWKYAGKPWVGVGINISFNEVKTEEAATKLNNE